MKTNAKVMLISSALLVALAGSAAAYNGYGNCFRGSPGFQGGGQCYQVPTNTRCMKAMNWRPMNMQGPGWGRGRNPSPMRGVFQLDDLTSGQLEQLDAIRQAQQDWRSERQASRNTRHNEIKAQLETILTDKQRETLKRWNQSGF